MKSSILLMTICLVHFNIFAQSTMYSGNFTNFNSGDKLLSNSQKTENTFWFETLNNSNNPEESYQGKFDYENPNYFSYFFTSTGFGLPKKSFYYHNQYIIGNTLGYGIHENFSLTGGVIFFPNPFSGEILTFYVFKPYVHFDLSKDYHLGGGILINHYSPKSPDQESLTLFFPYMVFTVGNSDANLSFQLTGISGDDLEEDSLDVMSSISGMYRISNHFVVVSENMFSIPSNENDYLIFTGIQGGRIIGKKGSFEFGLLITYDTEPDTMDKTSYGPYLGYSRKF